MSQIGKTPFSYKSPDVGGWGGMTTAASDAPYMFDLLENAYVSGGEIRPFPGYACVLDPVTQARTYTHSGVRGYEETHYDAQRPVSAAIGATTYNGSTTSTESQLVWTRPTTMHFVEQVNNRWQFVGESDGRRELIYNAARTSFVYVTGYQRVDANFFDITLNTAPDTTATNFNALGSAVAQVIYLEGLTGIHADTLNGSSWVVSTVTAAVVRISVSTASGSTTAVTGQTGFISRVGIHEDLSPGTRQATVGDDRESITLWETASNTANVDNPGDQLYCSHVANRQRDFGDATGNPYEGNTASTERISRRRQKTIPYRLVPHIAGNTMVLVAPGYGCVFQAPKNVPIDFTGAGDGSSGLPALSNDIYTKIRSMGVPKAVAWVDSDADPAGAGYHIYDAGSDTDISFGGTNVAVSARAGTYQFKFAYRDDVTGEIGLCSEPVSVTTTAAGAIGYQGIRICVYFPGYLMPECLALSILVYRTKQGGAEFYYDQTVPSRGLQNNSTRLAHSAKYGLIPLTSGGNYFEHVLYHAEYKTDAQLEENGTVLVPDTVQQMPMGAKAARTIRGFTMYGGALGDSGSRRELQFGSMSLIYDKSTNGVNGTNYKPNELTSLYSNTPGTPGYAGAEFGFGCAANNLPPAYAGQTLLSTTLFPYPRQSVVIDKLVNTTTGMAGTFPGTNKAHISDLRYEILETPLRENEDLITEKVVEDCYLILPRGKVQISEPDHPGQTPAVNTTVIANDRDEDVEAIGNYNGQPVYCSKSKTYMAGFSTSPVGAPAEIASDRFGCIAPNSMVEFDGGLAWISDRGPVAMTGNGFQWIGKPLERWFIGNTSRYKRDSLGMMRHSWACHDSLRGLIYFGMFANRYRNTAYEQTVTFGGTTYSWDDTDGVGSKTADRVRSRFACDEVLVYSYRDNAWSVWRPPACIAVRWMTTGMDSDEQSRVFWLGSDDRLYALDDLYGQFSKESNYASISQTGSTTTITGLTTTGLLGTPLVRAGQDVLFYKGGDPVELEFIGLRTVSSVTSTTVTLDSAITLPLGGCKMLIGPKRMKVRPTWITWKTGEPSNVGRVGIKFSLWSQYSTTDGGTGSRQAAFVSVDTVTSMRQDGYLTRKESSLTYGTFTPVGEDVDKIQSFSTTFAGGLSEGKGHQIELDIIGGTQLRLQDLFVEVG